MLHSFLNWVAYSCVCLLIVSNAAIAHDYNPLAVDANFQAKELELTAVDKDRQREVPLRVYLPAAEQPAPVVLFSHGLGGSRNNNGYLGRHWAARGYVCVFVQHPGSDESVWKDLPIRERMAAMRDAASLESFQARAFDIPFVIDQLTAWNRQNDHPLHQRLDLTKLGMSGHSFGAVTTQAVSGQSFPLVGQNLTDKRILAAVAFSPSLPRKGSVANAFSAVKIPWLLMTGTHDSAAIGGQTPESRREVFPNLPPGDKFQLVLDKAEHSAFGDRTLPGERQRRNPNHHRAILALSTAFWDAYLQEDAAAIAWLKGDGPRQVLEAADKWQTK